MTAKETVIQEIHNVPESICREVLDFIQFLKLKAQLQDNEPFLLSEKSLAKDWLTPEEDEAWRNL